jgi:UDP-glucuronate decarboxylase
MVTGGAGFLGSHLCAHLLRQGHDVLAVDNFFTGTRSNLANLMQHPRFELLRHDITFPLYVEVDTIFNLACPASPIWYQKDPVQTLKTSVLGMINCLGLAKRVKANIVQASTSEVYGDPSLSPQPESYWGNVNPIGPRSCYDEGKRAAETLCFDYVRQHGLDVRVVRIFNTYGPRMASDDGRVVSNFITQALNNQPITIYGKGSQTRSFCYVEDLIHGLISVGELDSLDGPMNLGTDNEVTVNDLAKLVLLLVGSSSSLHHEPLPHDDPTQRRPDLAKARAKIGWSPRWSLEDGLKETIAYFAGGSEGSSPKL